MEWNVEVKSSENLPRVGTLGKDLDNYLGIFSNYIILSSSAQEEQIKKKLTDVRTVLVRSWLNTTLKQSDCYSISSGILFHNLSYANADKNWGQHLHQIVICVGANFLRRNSGRQHGRRARFVHAQMVPSKSFFYLKESFVRPRRPYYSLGLPSDMTMKGGQSRLSIQVSIQIMIWDLM